jgi:hypothetical protein
MTSVLLEINLIALIAKAPLCRRVVCRHHRRARIDRRRRGNSGKRAAPAVVANGPPRGRSLNVGFIWCGGAAHVHSTGFMAAAGRV